MIAPNRRWFRFSLRTVFVVVTTSGLLCAWAGYELNWIRQRREFVQSDACAGTITERGYDGWPPSPWTVRLFRETGYAVIEVNFFPDEIFDEQAIANWRLTEEQQQSMKRVRHLFPEAREIMGGVWQTNVHDMAVLVTDYDSSTHEL